MLTMIKRFWNEEDGQGLTEYGLILGLVAVAVIGLLVTLGGEINEVFQKIVDSFSDVGGEGEGS